MSAPKLAYLLKKFPRLSETFVLGEILGQEALGAEIQIFSRRAPDDEPRHAELARLSAPCELMPAAREVNPWEELFHPAAPSEELFTGIQTLLAECGPLEIPRFSSLMSEALYLHRRCRELGVGHVHVHFATDSALTAMLLKGLGGPTYSVTAHAKDIYRTTVRPEVLRRIVSESEFLVTVCDANVEHLREMLGGDAPGRAAVGRVRRLYNGIDIAQFADGAVATASGGHILSVGRLVQKKGFDVLLDALALLAAEGVTFRATIVGAGDEAAALHEQRDRLGLAEKVEFTGPRDQDFVRDCMSKATLFCLPCVIGTDGNRDALPTVLLEAQAAGLPCVSTPVTGIPEILDDGRAGLLVPERDARATARAMRQLLEDADLRERTIDHGRKRARELFDSRKNSTVLHGWFEQVLARAPQVASK